MNWYCAMAPDEPVHQSYHAREYGFPARDEEVLFERLSLEVFQAGLSWALVLQKRPALKRAFDGFDVDRVAAYDSQRRDALLSDAGIIRNRRKIDAVIANAQVVRQLRTSHGGFAAFLDAHHPRAHRDWLLLLRATFRFMGPELVSEFLMSLGYLPGAHSQDCPVYKEVLTYRPPWLEAVEAGFDGYELA